MNKTGLGRTIKGKFYTKEYIANYFISKWKEVIKPKEDCLVIEPCAGNGSFFNPIFKEGKYQIIGYDIEPSCPSIIEKDFLTEDLSDIEDLHFIGNPGSLAKQFIKRCVKYGESISFILPKSFKKVSFQKTFPLNFHLIYEEDVSTIEGESVFQIWKKMNSERQIIDYEEPYKYTFVDRENNPHFSLRCSGINAGMISTETMDKNQESHYFIKLDEDIDQDTFEEEFLKLIFSHNTLVPRSISKQDFIKKINIIISSIE